jgi:uncharacterized protein YdeI (YjbR/CyaY-like superfamily)
MARPAEDEPPLTFASAPAWERWLERWHRRSDGIWMAIAKAGAGAASVSYSDALDVALCFGWIDGQKAALDDRAWLQRFTPRRPRSRWSQNNRVRIAALTAAGRMREAGLTEVERARADGRWADAYPGQRTATVPDDLQRALDANPAAREFFTTLDGANRYAILWRIHDARRPQTREQRIARFVEMLAANEKLHP